MKWKEIYQDTSDNPRIGEGKIEYEFYSDEGVLIGYVDPVYTHMGKNKYIASCAPEGQSESQEYVTSIEDGKAFVEEKYLLYKLTGVCDDYER